MNIENPGGSPTRLSVVLMTLVILTPLLLGIIVWYVVIQRNTATLQLTPEEAIQAFREAGLTIEDVQDVTYYTRPLHESPHGRELNLSIGSNTYSVYVILYSDQKEARKVAKEVNAFNDSMNGGHASAISYGALLVHVYPSDEPLTNRLYEILKGLETR